MNFLFTSSVFRRPMSGWVPGSIWLCAPTAAGAMSGCRAPLPPCWAPALVPSLMGKHRAKRGLPWTASLGAGERGTRMGRVAQTLAISVENLRQWSRGQHRGVRLWHRMLGTWGGAEQLLAMALACVRTDNAGPCTFCVCSDVP